MSFDDGENQQAKIRSYISSDKSSTHRRHSSGHQRGRQQHDYDRIFTPAQVGATPSSKRLNNVNLLRRPLSSTQQGSPANISGLATGQTPPSKRSRLSTDRSVETSHAIVQTDPLQSDVQLDVIQREHRELKELYTVKSNDCRQMNVELEKQKLDMEKYRADKNHAIRRYHKTYKEYVKYQESTSQLNEQLEAAKDQLKKVQEQNDANEQLMEERRVRLDQLSSENETLLKKLESQTKALEEQKSQEDDKLQKLKDEHARDLRKLDTNFAVEASKAAQAWKNQSLQKLAELNGVVKHLKDEVTEKDRLLLTSNTQVEKQKIEMREVLQTVEELKLANSQIKVERQQLEDERNETVQQYDVVKGQLEDRAKRIADLEREMASLQSINSNWNHWYQQFIAPAVANPPPPFSSSNSTFGTPLTPDTTSVDNVSVNPPLMKITKTD